MICTLPFSDKLCLVYDPAWGEGKTRNMAKGPFLGFQNAVFSGESAGFGLPVFKTDTRTVFPSLESSRMITKNVLEVIYRLDLIIGWRVMGRDKPVVFNKAMEAFTSIYMNLAGCQQFLLVLRKILFVFFRIQSSMAPGPDMGRCRIEYETKDMALNIRVDASAILEPGKLILLNEADGKSFTCFRIGDRIYDGNKIPAWMQWPIQTRVENPSYCIGFSISIPEEISDKWPIAGGREVSHELNWAGLSLTPDRRLFYYDIIIGRLNSKRSLPYFNKN